MDGAFDQRDFGGFANFAGTAFDNYHLTSDYYRQKWNARIIAETLVIFLCHEVIVERAALEDELDFDIIKSLRM